MEWETLASKTILCRKLAGGRFTEFEASVIIEKELAIEINGQRTAVASITPGLEKEFVTGYLFGQGFINSPADIAHLEIEGGVARVTLNDSVAKSTVSQKTTYRIVSGGGRSAFRDSKELNPIQSDIRVSRPAIFRAMSTLFEKASLYRETEGVHASGLFIADGQSIVTVEDIGRHNCLDKVIGWALLNKVDCSRTFLVSTGRMASEMVAKVCRARIPVVATKTAVTDKGREIGQKGGVTIIGFVRDAGVIIHTDMEVRIIEKPGMKIYTHPERIVCE
jgi:FdhD protein